MDFRVIFVAGWGRSGSTLVDNVMNSHPEITSLGELASIWRSGILERYRCGCGDLVVDCPFWQEVLRGVDGTDLDRTATRIASFQRAHLRERHLPRLLRPRVGESYQEYVDLLRRLYLSIARVSRASVLIDSSKTPTDAAATFHAVGANMVLVHLVRDPRGAAFSWGREKLKSDRGIAEPMNRRGAFNSSCRWAARNVGTEIVAKVHSIEYLRVKYEDFARDPATESDRILRAAGLAGEIEVSDNGAVELGGNHTVSGNPSRFDRGEVNIRMDDEWHQAMGGRDRIAATVASFPLLRRYSYPFRSKSQKTPA